VPDLVPPSAAIAARDVLVLGSLVDVCVYLDSLSGRSVR
jgi:hypothetical protein